MSRIDLSISLISAGVPPAMKGGKTITMAARNPYTHLNIEERKDLEELLQNPEITLKLIAAQMGRDPKCIREEIKRNRVLRVRANQRNKCGKQEECKRTRLCTHCLTGQCKFCTHDNCNEICDQFFPEPVCKRTTRFPNVCNGCPDSSKCKLPRMYYIATTAQANYERNVRDWKRGPRPDEIEMARISKIVKKGIESGHSLDVIAHENDIPACTSTLYRYVNTRYIAGVVRVDMKRAVKYRTRNKVKVTPINYDHLNGRRYEDFLARMENDPPAFLWEMDTVIGKQGSDEKCALSLLFRPTNLQLYFLLDSKTMSEVNRVFDGIKRTIGPEMFKQYFEVILTDNGSEFYDPLSIETDPDTGEKLISIYYCKARHSEQKGKAEKNHEHFRELVPKGKSMNDMTKKDMRYVSNMVNNYPRKKFQYQTPLELSKPFLNEMVFKLNNLHTLPSCQVKMKPII